MKILILVVFFIPLHSYTQLSGDLKSDSRKVINQIEYNMVGKHPGILAFDISVDVNGKVTSCTYNQSESTFRNTPAIIAAKNTILTGLVFESGHSFPKYHQGQVKITFKKD